MYGKITHMICQIGVNTCLPSPDKRPMGLDAQLKLVLFHVLNIYLLYFTVRWNMIMYIYLAQTSGYRWLFSAAAEAPIFGVGGTHFGTKVLSHNFEGTCVGSEKLRDDSLENEGSPSKLGTPLSIFGFLNPDRSLWSAKWSERLYCNGLNHICTG